jgi:hypothetical protein
VPRSCPTGEAALLPIFESERACEKSAEGHEASPPARPRGCGEPVLKAFYEVTGFPLELTPASAGLERADLAIPSHARKREASPFANAFTTGSYLRMGEPWGLFPLYNFDSAERSLLTRPDESDIR